jgi:hypothetical protein
MLILIMSLSGMISPPYKRKDHNLSIGHFYFACLGHYHFGGTDISNYNSTEVQKNGSA